MSVATPTVLPRPLIFPHLLSKLPQPNPAPIPKNKRTYAHLNARRDLHREMDDLSDEETELEDLNIEIHNRGYKFLIPIGLRLTQQEEKNDADEDTDSQSGSGSGSGSGQTVSEASGAGDTDNGDSGQDLDASMDDMDDEMGNMTGDTDESMEQEPEGSMEEEDHPAV